MKLLQLEIRNLRGYSNGKLSLVRPITVLVGPNNSGKTSFFLLLDWLMNHFDVSGFVNGAYYPSDKELALLKPARETGRNARRLSLQVRIDDQQMYQRYKCIDGVATLRVDLKTTPKPIIRLKLGPPKRSDDWVSSDLAIQLIKNIREKVAFLHVPAFRDVKSPRFQDTLRNALHAKLLVRGHASARGGTPGEYRAIRDATTTLQNTAESLVQSLWEEISNHLPPGLARQAQFSFNATNQDVLAFMRDNVEFKLNTGDHDVNKVMVEEVGSGLQSLLDLAMISSAENNGEKFQIFAIEEPEAFLHPSAQRMIVNVSVQPPDPLPRPNAPALFGEPAMVSILSNYGRDTTRLAG
ncbi:hypothetical protein DV096_15445 [Bradymonadaceae bacterium TMQ3]|nr:hypothetical protein DV096_15445 [Bradymonadaceae bacterium TMQ3]TXC73030.1 ATP-binding protein [Bradymonadales bacterium TMQ1]